MTWYLSDADLLPFTDLVKSSLIGEPKLGVTSAHQCFIMQGRV